MKRSKSTIPAGHNLYTSEQNRTALERLIFFSDAVFAIAITLLVIDIHLPAGAATADDSQMLVMLLGLWHKYLAFVISFWVIGLYWINHHRKFLFIKRWDRLLLAINLSLLMVIAFIPFPSSVVSENDNRTAIIFYALVMALAGLLLALLWLHAAHNHRLIDPQLSKQRQWREAIGPLVSSAIFLISIGFAFVDKNLVRVCWLLIIPASLFINARRDTA